MRERKRFGVPIAAKAVFFGEGEVEGNGQLVDYEENRLRDLVGGRDHVVRVHISASDPIRE